MPINSLIPQVVFNNKVSYISMYVLMQPTYTYVKYTKNDKKPNMQHEFDPPRNNQIYIVFLPTS